ncbi:transglycosylase domain-containing protein [Cellulomonas triticagri]|uniref:Penicillin-binding protein n=1 Tax=Cellulomonas triticagri TaxID=2483352 RepID=A0A3M2IU77_9CELL|nr:transglycosylase domain-containing protein [Cellulomonas triticagri]RMI03416.1 penicillin-binding protein [Cellulomonas triticagri]
MVRRPPRSRTSSTSHGRHVTPVQAVALLLTFVLTAGVGGLLTAGLVLPVVAVADTATDLSVEAFDDLPTELARQPLSERSVMRAADGTVIAEFFAQNRVVVSLDQIAGPMQDAVVAIEDRRFYRHGGIDPAGMARAAVRQALGKGQEGASTLTQQYVKNVLIDAADRRGDQIGVEAAREPTYARKLREAKLAIALEKELTKDQILEGYLNIAQFGVKIYGVESAALRFFSKHASELTYLEAATIAGITQRPSDLDPTLHPEATQGRRDDVLRAMRREGFITVEEYEAGRATPLPDTLRVSEPQSGCMAAGAVVQGSGYFCDYVTKVIQNDPVFGETPEIRERLLLNGGLDITTTLDPRLQTIADTEVKSTVPVDDPTGVGSAISVVEPGSGHIRAMAQNRNFNNTGDAAGRDNSVNYNASYSYGGSNGFMPGSTFKPFTLLEWLKQGKSLADRVDGTARNIDTSQFTACGQRYSRDTWPVRNAEGGSGQMSVAQATQRSVNLAYVTMAMQLDLCAIMDGAAQLGVTSSTSGTEGQPVAAVPSNVLGSGSTSPLALAGAYAAFAAGGVYCRPIALTSVKNADGVDLPIPDAGCAQTIAPDVAAGMNEAMSNVWRGTGSELGTRPYPASGKTGTTTHNEHTWFVGYTPRLASAVWVGYPDRNIPMQRITINGRYARNAFGATYAGRTWVNVMDQVLADGQANPGFAPPSADIQFGKPVPVPSVIGLDEASAVAALEGAGFSATVGGTTPSPVTPGAVASQSPSGAAPVGSVVTLTLSSGPDAVPASGPPAAGPPPPGQG